MTLLVLTSVLQLVTELGQGGASRGGGGSVGGGAGLGVASVAYPSSDGDQANALLAAYVGAVGTGVREALLAV